MTNHNPPKVCPTCSLSEPSWGVCNCKVERYRQALQNVCDNIGVPQPGYPAPIAYAYECAKKALEGDDAD